MKRFLFLLGLLSCHQSAGLRAIDAGPSGPAVLAPPEPPSPSASTLRIAEVTPGIIAKAEEILNANSGAELGAEFPFELDGGSFVARFEQHDNPDGDPNRPLGQHKGITVYERR